jgi:uncharacterized membrane protein YhaH (DUF805 family)
MPLSQLLFSFQGRLNRKPYWMTILATAVIVLLLIVFALVMFGEHDFWAGGALLAVLVILYIPLIWISLAIGAKRLHDRDKSAWWLLLFYLAPSVLSAAPPTTPATWASSSTSRASPSRFGLLSSSAACVARWGPIAMAPIR